MSAAGALGRQSLPPVLLGTLQASRPRQLGRRTLPHRRRDLAAGRGAGRGRDGRMIHPTAIVDVRAEIDASAVVGPYVVIEGPARIGARTRLAAHAVILGGAELGADNVVHSGSVIGDVPQDVAFG